MPITPSQQAFLDEAATSCLQIEMSTGVPAELPLAQAILESGWGKFRPGNNIFGIKSVGGPNEYGRQLLLTREYLTDKELAWFLHLNDSRTAELVDPTQAPNNAGRQQYRVQDWFATFPSLTACFAKRASLFIHGVYGQYLLVYANDHNFDAYLRSVAKVYATAPNYADIILSIIRMSEVVEALQDAKEAVGKLSA